MSQATPELAVGDIVKIRRKWLVSDYHRNRTPWILNFGGVLQRVIETRTSIGGRKEVKTDVDNTFRHIDWYKKVKL